jgi:hypothetical protein
MITPDVGSLEYIEETNIIVVKDTRRSSRACAARSR